MGSSTYLGGSTVINIGNRTSDWPHKSSGIRQKQQEDKCRKESTKALKREKGRINALRCELLQKISREQGKWDVKYLTNDQKIALYDEIIQEGGLTKWTESHKNLLKKHQATKQ